MTWLYIIILMILSLDKICMYRDKTGPTVQNIKDRKGLLLWKFPYLPPAPQSQHPLPIPTVQNIKDKKGLLLWKFPMYLPIVQ